MTVASSAENSRAPVSSTAKATPAETHEILEEIKQSYERQISELQEKLEAKAQPEPEPQDDLKEDFSEEVANLKSENTELKERISELTDAVEQLRADLASKDQQIRELLAAAAAHKDVVRINLALRYRKQKLPSLTFRRDLISWCQDTRRGRKEMSSMMAIFTRSRKMTCKLLCDNICKICF